MAKAKYVPLRDIGRCVYCTDDNPPLTEEHIVPAGLGGEQTLTNASCEKCQKIINREIETPCLQWMFRDIRYKRHLGRRRAKERPKTLPILKSRSEHAEVQDKNAWKNKEVPYNHHPTLLAMPIFRRPGIFHHGPEPLAPYSGEFALWTHIEPHDQDEIDSGGALVQMKFGINEFCRLVAKIAHCCAVAHFGVDGFTPWLTDFIRGLDRRQQWHLIGSKLETDPADSKANVIEFGQLRDEQKKHLIVCSVRIFAHLGAPTYIAVVGKKNLRPVWLD